MKSIQFKLVLFILVSTLLISCSAEDEGIFFNDTFEATVDYTDIELEILDLVNNHRQSLGLSELGSLDIVSLVADTHTNYMIEVGVISHDHFNERAEILKKDGNAKTVAENVAYGYNSAVGVFNGWLSSDNHRAIIESPGFSHCGISTAKNIDGRNYFTQIFINR